MTISDDIHQLIHALSQSEKRYFRIFASLHVKGEQNNYLKLFDAISKQPVYDEAALVKAFAGQKFTEQFSVTKNYLYNIILKSLRSYYSGNDISSKINEGIESAKILFGKGLYKKSAQILKKQKQLARQYEQYEQLLIILQLEGEVMYRYLNPEKLYAYLEEAGAEIQEIFRIMENLNTIIRLEDEIYKLYRKQSVARSEEDLEPFNQIINHELLKDGGNTLSLKARSSYFDIFATYHTVKNDYLATSRFEEEKIGLFEDNPHYRKENLSEYIGALNNLVIVYSELDKEQLFHETIARMRAIPKKHPNINQTLQAKIFETTYNLELDYYDRRKDYKSGRKLIADVEAGIEKYRPVLMDDFIVVMQFTISKLLFFSGHIDEAHDWVSRIVYDGQESGADDYLCFARILNLLIHFELGNDELLKYEIKATQRFLVKKKQFYKMEKTILRSLNSLVQTKDPSKRTKLLQKFYHQLTQTSEQPFEEHAQAIL